MDSAKRIAKVVNAAEDMPTLLKDACRASAEYGDTDTRALAAWDLVEQSGAIIHRQARILSGKPRGG